MAENYTWEKYFVLLDDEQVCLKCASEIHFGDDTNWIHPEDVQSVTLTGDGPLFEDGILNVAKCQHVLGVEQPLPAGIKFVANAEFDSMDGHQISGDRLIEVIRRLDEPFCPVLDAAYQFAVSIGIYVRLGEESVLQKAA